MSTSVPLQIAETIQTASIKRHPSPTHDLNPSTAASQKQPVISHPIPASETSLEKYPEDEFGLDEDEDEEEIPYSVIKPLPRRMSFGPLPDLRFEQSYLASIASAETRWRVAWITVRDQVCFQWLEYENGRRLMDSGLDAASTRHDLVSCGPWMAALASDCAVERK
jgi:hypothetical protein